MIKFLELLSIEFSSEATAATIGTKRDRLIKKITRNDDPYRELKHHSNIQALKMLPKARQFIKGRRRSYERFKAACIVSILGNLIEFDIIGHEFDFKKLNRLFANTELTIDDTRTIYNLLKHSKNVVLLADNAGAIVFDVVLIDEIRHIGPSVTVAVKKEPALNDATLIDADELGMRRVADVITTGTDTLGLLLEEASAELKRKIRGCDLLVVKGMANYETLSDQRMSVPMAFLLMAKCDPIAIDLGVKKGSAVAKLVKPS